MNKTILLSAIAVTLAGAGAVLAAQAPPAQPMSFFITSTTPGGGNVSWNSVHMSAGCSKDKLIMTGGAGHLYCFAIN